MFQATDDVRIDGLKPLIPPAILMEEMPLTEGATPCSRLAGWLTILSKGTTIA
jgi:hypothetical protein